MYKKLYATMLLFVSIINVSAVWSMDDDTNANNYTTTAYAGLQKIGNAFANALYDSYGLPAIGLGLLAWNRNILKENSLLAAGVGSVFLASFAKNILPNRWQNNFVTKTWSGYPLFTFLAGHTVLCNRDQIRNNPLESLGIACTLTYRLAQNYLGKSDGDQSSIVGFCNDSTLIFLAALGYRKSEAGSNVSNMVG